MNIQEQTDIVHQKVYDFLLYLYPLLSNFVGYKHRGTHKKVRRDSIKRINRTIKQYIKGKITKDALQRSLKAGRNTQNARTAITCKERS